MGKNDEYIMKTEQEHIIQNELKMLRLLHHPNIINLVDFFDNKAIIIEKMDQDLLDHIQNTKIKICECRGRKIFKQVCDAVEFIHQNGIAHMDLSLENILINKNGRVKICDFGLSMVVKNYDNYGNGNGIGIGKETYCSPELYYGQKIDPLKNDVYSLGIILFAVLTGSAPYITMSRSDLRFSIFRSVYGDVPLVISIRPVIEKSIKVYEKLTEMFVRDEIIVVVDLFRKMLTYQQHRYYIENVHSHKWMKIEECGNHND